MDKEDRIKGKAWFGKRRRTAGLCLGALLLVGALFLYTFARSEEVGSSSLRVILDLEEMESRTLAWLERDDVKKYVKNSHVCQRQEAPDTFRLANEPHEQVIPEGNISVELQTRFQQKGMPFLDAYLPIPWNISAAVSSWWSARQAFGSDSRVRPGDCVADQGKRLILHHGGRDSDLSKALSTLTDYAVLAGDTQERYTLLFLQDSNKRYPHGVPCLNDVMGRFLLYDMPEITCHSQMEEEKEESHRISGLESKFSSYLISKKLDSNLNETIAGLRVLLLRQFIRLKPMTRNALDHLQRIALSRLCIDDHNTRVIAIHIPGQKASEIPKYIHVLQTTVDRMDRRKHLLLHVIVEEKHIIESFSNAIKSALHDEFASIQISFRVSNLENVPCESMPGAFLRQLADYRLIATSDAFIGSQSSNVGIIGCMLRTYSGCYNTDHPKLEWSILNQY